jgi:Esterase/lipase
MHEPILKEHKNSEKIVIFIHGFMGTPDHFKYFADTVFDSGCSYYTILLPGHGDTSKTFSKKGINDWTPYVISEIKKFSEKYKKIYLVGHSMGGLLSLNSSLLFNNVSCVFILSSPLKLSLFTPKSFYRKFKLLFLPKNSEIKKTYAKSISLSNINFFSFFTWKKPVLGLLKLMKITRSNLNKITIPVIMFYSKNDEITSFKSSDILYNGLSSKIKDRIIFTKSTHVYYTPEDTKKILNKLIEHIK